MAQGKFKGTGKGWHGGPQSSPKRKNGSCSSRSISWLLLEGRPSLTLKSMIQLFTVWSTRSLTQGSQCIRHSFAGEEGEASEVKSLHSPPDIPWGRQTASIHVCLLRAPNLNLFILPLLSHPSLHIPNSACP